MKELLSDLDRLRKQNVRAAWARVVLVEGSGPRDPGAALILTEQGDVIGSVSGGCVEGAVVGECEEVLAGGSSRLVSYGVADEDSFAVGLTCGGTVHIFVEAIDWLLYDEIREAFESDEGAVLATIVEGRGVGQKVMVRSDGLRRGTLSSPGLDAAVVRDAVGHWATGQSSLRRYGATGRLDMTGVAVFLEVFAPPPLMLILGAVDFAAALARVAKLLGYRVTICDPRPLFATASRFPMADQVVVDWPHRYLDSAQAPTLTERDAVCVLTHDHKIDVPALVKVLETRVGYIGAMGSRLTTEQRNERLRDAGVFDDALGRILAPIGLDLGARTPDETAISICAEIILLRTGHAGDLLSLSRKAIHSAGQSTDSRTRLHQAYALSDTNPQGDVSRPHGYRRGPR